MTTPINDQIKTPAKNFKIVIEYDGASYAGWQRQKTDRTLQGEIENALRTMTRTKINLIGSGRTDAGVHALGQVANFHCQTRLEPVDFFKGLNSLLDDDIVIRGCERVPDTFHARYDAKGKTYRYHIHNHKLPVAVGRQYVWYIRHPLDIQAMQQAAAGIVGEYDFRAFEGAGSPRAHTVRTVWRAEIQKVADSAVEFEIEANGFLRFMVRNIVGALVAVGCRKISPEAFAGILAGKDRTKAPPTAPPQGLFLVAVHY